VVGQGSQRRGKKVKEIAAKATKLAEYVADNQAKDLGSE